MHVSELPGYDLEVQAHDDEKCFGILETELWADVAGKRVVHRFQIIDFLRGSTKLREVRDLSELKLYSILDAHPPMQILCMLEHTVGEAKEMADAARDRKKVRDTLAVAAASSTLIQDAITQAEIKQKIRRRASHFGSRSPGRTSGTQRN